MSKAVAARLQGDDYQIRFFWLNVCRLFSDHTKVANVEIESDNVKSLDDVVVRYQNFTEMGESIHADFFQVKFHVTAHGSFTWESMMDPSFINASSVSILQRLLNAQREHAPDGSGCRFNIYSPWAIHPDDELAAFCSLSDGRFLWDKLSQGGGKSKMGRVREQWKKHLGLKTDEELKRLLNLVRLQQGPQLKQLGADLNLHLNVVGLKPVEQGAVNPYDDLGRKLIQSGQKSFSRDVIKRICEENCLWIGRKASESDAVKLGIRSFRRYAEHLEEEVDKTLCLLEHFNGRYPIMSDAWNRVIAPLVASFLGESTDQYHTYHIRLQTHGSIAFVAGFELSPKSSVNIVPVQDGYIGRQVWRCSIITPEIEQKYPHWQINHTKIESSGGQDTIVIISATHNIEHDVLSYANKHIKNVGAAIHCLLPSSGPTSVIDGTHAQLLAQQLISAVRAMRGGNNYEGTVHFFFAAPNGFMFILGRLAHVLHRLNLYEYDFERGGSAYTPSISINPKNNIMK